MRLPLSGSRRIFSSDGGQDAIRGLLNVLQAFQKQLGISTVEADVVLRGSAGFKSNRRANNERLFFRLTTDQRRNDHDAFFALADEATFRQV